MARVVLTTFGSLGDLHPYVALARELLARGHRPLLATHGLYRERVEAAGIEFRAVRPDLADLGDPAETMRRAIASPRATEYVVRRLVLPHVRASYEDLLAACEGADALVGHVLTVAVPLVAEKRGLPRVHTVLQPLTLFSAHDPPVLSTAPASRWALRLPPAVWKPLWALARATSRPWFRGLDALRAEAGLPPASGHPLLDDFSSVLNLALFSPVLARPQPDWPPRTVTTGFAFWDRDGAGEGMPAALREFLDAGPPPLVFTLGSSAVWAAGTFYREAVKAAGLLGRRAVLLTGPQLAVPAGRLPGDVMAVPYAPHSELFARAAAIVHQGGIGTTGQALRAGRPMLIVPFSHDQPDNAVRCARLGVAGVVQRHGLRAGRLAGSLDALLGDPAVRARAEQIGAQIRGERGASAAVNAIEGALARG
jgi:UDP:flavonoid glycosyltransferase YjiC (YdhE family)